MSDISLPWGGDVQPDETGDILCVDGNDELSQRIVRRIGTNPYLRDTANGVISDPDYVFEPDYGGGLRAYVDAPNSLQTVNTVRNRVLDQLSKESGVDMTVAPSINIKRLANGIAITGIVATPNGQTLPLPQMEITT